MDICGKVYNRRLLKVIYYYVMGLICSMGNCEGNCKIFIVPGSGVNDSARGLKSDVLGQKVRIQQAAVNNPQPTLFYLPMLYYLLLMTGVCERTKKIKPRY
ncbi:hypothetical protein BsWGS_21442 [Bradybaena similaris]